MVSTSTKKKEIVDFLWEWAENHGDWSNLLISKIVNTESILSSSDRQSVFNYFLQSINLYTCLSSLSIVKPTYTPTSKTIELKTLSSITGVNRLAKNQTLTFSKNLTVVFGENGTGKTGYSRVLKTLGFSYDSNNVIFPNIFKATQPKTAKIEFKANGVDDVFNWDGTNKNSELENISVFNSNCVQISLSDRQLIVSPIGFHLFNLVTSELNELMKLLNAKITTYPTTLSWSETLNQGTLQQVYISELSKISTGQKLSELSSFTPAQEQELKDKEVELSNFNKTLLQTEIQNLTTSISEIKALIIKVQTAQTQLNSNNWKALIDFNKQISELESKTKTGVKEIAEANGIEFYKTQQFQSFLTAAEEYIKIINKPKYPSDNDSCVYCLQPLESSAKNLLSSYRILLNDKTQENLLVLKEQKTNLIQQILKIDINLIFHQSTFGVDDKQNPVQPTVLLDYNKKLGILKTAFTTDKIDKNSSFNFDYKSQIDFLEAKNTALNEILTQKQGLLANLSVKETELRNKIAELKDRKLLLLKVSEIKASIENHKIISTLNSTSISFSTASISRKTTEARDALVKSNFNAIFKAELKCLRKSHINIDLSFRTDRGNSKISHSIKAHLLVDILSEGEQKAIAFAEFLTELQLDNIKAPVIFDDPVNSLDHKIIDDVARRLIKLSNERQVVIFTHSVLLFNSFLYFSKQPSFKGLDYKFYNSKNEYDETGFITDAEEEINKVKSFISKINMIINNTPKDKPEADVAEDGYGYLRSAIELLVEHEIFQGTVKRYQKNIALTQFVKVDGNLINTHKDKLNEIFERSCGYIKGHSNPTAIYNAPTIAELKVDFEDFKIIRDVFLK
ncbi:MAG: AAA family ATPase [Candidatus Scalindua sp.]